MTSRIWFLTLTMIIPAAGGCSEGGFGESVSLPQERHESAADAFARGEVLNLPGTVEFNLADSQRSATGAGQAGSTADSHGTASCSATAEGPGTATAEFQLGHVLDNRGDEPLRATAEFQLEYECSVVADPTDREKPDDHLGLRVFIRDSDKRILHDLTLTEVSPFIGPTQWSGGQRQTFDVTLKPRLAYYFVVAGRTSATGTKASGANAELQVSKVSLKLVPKH